MSLERLQVQNDSEGSRVSLNDLGWSGNDFNTLTEKNAYQFSILQLQTLFKRWSYPIKKLVTRFSRSKNRFPSRCETANLRGLSTAALDGFGEPFAARNRMTLHETRYRNFDLSTPDSILPRSPVSPLLFVPEISIFRYPGRPSFSYRASHPWHQFATMGPGWNWAKKLVNVSGGEERAFLRPVAFIRYFRTIRLITGREILGERYWQSTGKDLLRSRENFLFWKNEISLRQDSNFCRLSGSQPP